MPQLSLYVTHEQLKKSRMKRVRTKCRFQNGL